MKKKNYLRPEVSMVYSYDLETELMYGGGLSGASATNFGITNPINFQNVDDDNDSDRAKGNNVWDVSWDD